MEINHALLASISKIEEVPARAQDLQEATKAPLQECLPDISGTGEIKYPAWKKISNLSMKFYRRIDVATPPPTSL